MSSEIVRRNLAHLAGPTNWERGHALFAERAILDVHLNARSVEARIANDQGAFDSVKITFRQGHINSRCTCAQPTRICEHGVACLLLVAEENPQLVSFLRQPDYVTSLTSGRGGVPQPAEPPPTPAQPKVIPAVRGTASESFRDYVTGTSKHAELHLLVDGSMPTMESRWNRIKLSAKLRVGKRYYSSGNIKRLIESQRAAGGMQLGDFSPQEQQVMRFLVTHAEISGNRMQVNAHDVSDLFHCLVGFPRFRCESGPVVTHEEPIELCLRVSDAGDEGAVVSPRFLLPGRGALPPGRTAYVAGRGGYWVGLQNEYWWMPGRLPLPWLIFFLRGDPMTFAEDGLQRLSMLCESGALPARVVTAEAADLEAVPGDCYPRLTLDWRQRDIAAALEFQYGGRPIDRRQPGAVWQGSRFVMRDLAAEKEAEEALSDWGFEQDLRRRDGHRLTGREAIWRFLHEGIPSLREQDWRLLWTPEFGEKRSASTELRLAVSVGEEGDSWFETTCTLSAGGGVAVPWELVSDAIRRKKHYIQLEDGTLVRLPADVLRILRLFARRATDRKGETFRFGMYAAVPMGETLAPYWHGRKGVWQRLRDRLLKPPSGPDPAIPEDLSGRLRDYQHEGVRWIRMLADCNFHGILADEMGLGKTVQALAAIAAHKAGSKRQKPSMIICPTSLLENWLSEAGRFVPHLRCTVVQGALRHQLIQDAHEVDIVITSYALMRRDIADYDGMEFDFIVLDEAQHIKNPRTANARTCKELQGDNRLILTGTPVENSMAEMWSLFDFLLPGLLGSLHEFRQDYILPAANGEADRVTAELAAHIRPFILRRTKKQVCRELPDKIEQTIYCDFGDEQRKLYDAMLGAGRQMLEEARRSGWRERRFELLSILLRLRQICCHPSLLPDELRGDYSGRMPSVKMELAREVIMEAIDSGHRLLFFSQFTGVLALLRPWLEENGIPYEYLDGNTKDRQARVDRFNACPEIPIFLLSLKAGGTGLNLTGADTVIHYDLWWNPMVEDQATDRTHRIGQTLTVTALKLLVRNSVEEKILALQESKRDLFEKLVAGSPTRIGELTPEDVEFLFSP